MQQVIETSLSPDSVAGLNSVDTMQACLNSHKVLTVVCRSHDRHAIAIDQLPSFDMLDDQIGLVFRSGLHGLLRIEDAEKAQARHINAKIAAAAELNAQTVAATVGLSQSQRE